MGDLHASESDRGIHLVGSCASSASTGPSDTYGRSPERDILERGKRELWALLCRPSCSQNERISRCRTIGLWALIGARSGIRSVCSTVTVAGWGNGPLIMMAPV